MARMKRGELVQLAKSLKLDLPAKETSQLIDQALHSPDPAKFLREQATKQQPPAPKPADVYASNPATGNFEPTGEKVAVRADCDTAAGSISVTPLGDDGEPVIDRNDLIGFAGSLGLAADRTPDFEAMIDDALTQADPRGYLQEFATIAAEEMAPEPDAQPVITITTIEVPLCQPCDVKHKFRHLQLQLRSHHATTFSRVYRGLLAKGATLRSGKTVKSLAQAALWLIEQADKSPSTEKAD